MTIWEGASFGGEKASKKRGQQHMTADSVYTPSHPPDYARYLVVTILKNLGRDLTEIGKNGMMWIESEMSIYVAAVFRNSKVSYSVLLTALLYLLRFRHTLKTDSSNTYTYYTCGDSLPVIFVSSLILANKFLHDRHSSNLAWSVQTGIPTAEINKGEIMFLEMIQHRLSVDQIAFQKWISILFHPANLINYYNSTQNIPTRDAKRHLNTSRQGYNYAHSDDCKTIHFPIIDHYNYRPEMVFSGNFTAS